MSNLKSLITKELKLALHPTAILFLALSFMILIPNYPFYVTFFYTGLGVFFICLQGRENHDIFFTMMLPVKKADVVKARFALVLIVELLQVLIAIIATLIRTFIMKLPNQAGMDANIAFFGLALIMLGLFNYSFFTTYYSNTAKVGKAFAVSATVVWIYILAAEACCFAVPFFRNVLDTLDPANIGAKLIVLVIGFVFFVILTFLSQRKSIKLFEKADF